MKDPILKILKDCANLFWYCDVCASGINEKLDIAKTIEKLEQQTKEYVKNSSDILKKLENTMTEYPVKNEWSTIVKRSKFPPNRKM